MRKILAAWCFALCAFIAVPAHAQTSSLVVLPNGCGTGKPTGVNSLGYLTVDTSLKLCVDATVTANVGATAQATLPTVAPGSGAALYESLSGGLFVQPIFGTTLVDGTHGLPTILTSQYPSGATPITASATGTTAATTATLAASASLKTYLCGFSIRANATAAATANSTVTGSVTGTLNYTQWTAPNASGIGLTEQIFTPCVPSSAVNTAVAVVSAAPGTGGVVSVTAWGYQGN